MSVTRSLKKEPFIHIRFCGDYKVTGGLREFRGHVIYTGRVSRDGIFSEWDWDGRQLIVRNDRYGFQPLYYFSTPNEVCVSPSITTLLDRGVSKEPDLAALAVFFRLGFFIGEDTPFKAIKTVPPNVAFSWTKDGLQISQQYLPIKPTEISRDVAHRTYLELFSTAVHRRPSEGRSGVLLSGGRDSRHILFELCQSGHKPDLVATVNLPRNTDGTVASAVAATLGLRHMLVPSPRPSVANERRKNKETNFCADEHSWILDLRDRLLGKVYTLYDGIGGDVLSAGLFLDSGNLRLYRSGQLDSLARRLLSQNDADVFLRRLLPPDRYQEVSEERAIARLVSELSRHAGAPNPTGSFYFWNRTRREIALSPFGIFSDFLVYAPYLDHDLFDFLASLPAEMLIEHTFHDQTIAIGYPQWAGLDYSRKVSSRMSLSAIPWVLDTLQLVLRRKCPWIRRAFLIPRLIRAICDPYYNRVASTYLTGLPIYVLQLAELMAKSLRD